MSEVVIIAAVARNGVIGSNGALPWHLPEDLRHFKALTLGHPILMGRRTWESLPRPLPGRRNIVVSRDAQWQPVGAERAGSLQQALTWTAAAPKVFVIGGAQLYAAALPLADALELTEIDADFDGDTRFPDWPREQFIETSRQPAVSAGGLRYALVSYRRKTSV